MSHELKSYNRLMNEKNSAISKKKINELSPIDLISYLPGEGKILIIL